MTNGNARDTTEPAQTHQTKSEARQGHEVALLLTAAAVLAALIGGRASALSASASTSWQEATRAQVKQAAAYVEQIRYVYGVEVPRALSLMEMRFRAEELAQIVEDEDVGRSALSFLRYEKAVQDEALKASLPASTLAAEPKYQTDAGFDPLLMLQDERATEPDLVNLNPGGLHEEGDETSDDAIRMIASTAPIAISFLCGSMARVYARGRRIWLVAGILFLVVGAASAAVVEVA